MKICRPRDLADTYHFIGSGGRATDAKHGVAFVEKTGRDGMEDLIEHFVAQLLRSAEGDEWESEPLAENRNVSRAKNRQREGFHGLHVLLD